MNAYIYSTYDMRACVHVFSIPTSLPLEMHTHIHHMNAYIYSTCDMRAGVHVCVCVCAYIYGTYDMRAGVHVYVPREPILLAVLVHKAGLDALANKKRAERDGCTPLIIGA